MDLFSLGFLVLILAVSGLIAWIADGLGKKIGKKRISFAGLRPKHVASLGTVAMGVAVSFFTIFFIAVFSRDARTWLRKGRGLIVEVQRLQDETRDAQAEVDRLSAERQRLLASNTRLEGQNASLESTNKGLQKDVQVLRNDFDREEALLTQERGSLARVRTERNGLLVQSKSLRLQVVALGRQVAEAKQRFALAQAALDKAQTSLTRTTKELTVAVKNRNVALKEKESALTKSYETNIKNQGLEAEIKDREASVQSLKDEQKRLVAERDSAQRQVEAAQDQYTKLQTQLASVQNDLFILNDRFAGASDFLKTTTRSSRTEGMTFRKGEELARVVIPAGANQDLTDTLVSTLLRSARLEAERRGAKARKVDGETYEAADIMDRKDPETGAKIAADALRRDLVAAVAGGRQDQVIVASSTLNAFAGEPVSLDLAVLPNPLVYRRNDMVAEAQIDGSQPEDKILAQLSAFMAGRVRDRAVRDKMIPRLMTPAPFGEVPTFEVLNLVRDVKQRGRNVRVQALAEGDTRAADPLRLEFRVR